MKDVLRSHTISCRNQFRSLNNGHVARPRLVSFLYIVCALHSTVLFLIRPHLNRNLSNNWYDQVWLQTRHVLICLSRCMAVGDIVLQIVQGKVYRRTEVITVLAFAEI